MGTNRIPGPGSRIPPRAAAQGAEAKAVDTPPSGAAATDVRSVELPPAGTSLAGKASPLSGVIAEGLAQLAKAEGWSAQQSALDVLVGAMTRARPAEASTPRRPDAMSEMGFTRLLQAHAPPEKRAQAKEDGRKLAALALVALGESGLEGMRKTDQAAQLEVDLRAVRGALAEVLASGDERGRARLERLAEDLAWVGGALAGSKGANGARPRVDAVAAMIRILLDYRL